MAETKERVAGLIVPLFYEQLYLFNERWITGSVRLYNFAAPLIYDDKMVVFIEYAVFNHNSGD